MWSSVLSMRSQQSSSAGGAEENRGGERRRLPKLKNPAKFWKNSSTRQQNRSHTEENELECVEEKELLEEVSRRLIIREEQVFSQDCPSEDEDQLQKDYEALKLQILMAIDNTFSTPSSLGHLDVLRSAVASIQQQEVQDRRWTDCSGDRLPVWRPLKCLSSHNSLLQNIVDSRLKTAAEDELTGPDRLSSPVKREVCRMGTRVKEDLLVVRTMRDCYPPQMDILNVYAGLYHQGFSARLMELAASGLDIDDCSYLLFWVNHFYPDKILKHEDLDGQIKTVCLGSLLLQDHLKQLEEQYLSHKEDKVKLWLGTALKKEEESWLSGRKPELIDSYYFSPLAVDVIQVIDSSLTEFSHVIRDQSRIQRITAHLDSFLGSYKKSVEEFMKGNHSNICSVVKAHLVCEEQLRDYITTGSLPEQQRRRCLDTLSALRDCGYRYLTCPIHVQLKVCYKNLWTPDWLDTSPPVVVSLLDSLNEHLMDLTDLKPACRQSLLGVLHQDVALQYVKRMMKNRMKSREQQQAGAQKMKEDVQMMDDFFKEQGCSESSWFSKVLCSVAEVLRLQDPGSVHLEMVSLARTCPDLSNAHVSALLSLKIGLSSADMRSIRQSLEENRLLDVSTNHSPPFFSKVKVKWITNKINQMGL